MRKVFTLIVLLLISLTVLEIIVMTIGHAMLFSYRVQQLHLTDCRLPCWAQIRLGQKSVDVERELSTYAQYAGYQVGSVSQEEEGVPDRERQIFLIPTHGSNQAKQIPIQLFFLKGELYLVSIPCDCYDRTKVDMPTLGEI